MRVHLTGELEQMVQHSIDTGRYRSADEMVEEALRLIRQRDQAIELHKEALRNKIAVGMESLRQGRHVDGESAFDELLADLDPDKDA